MRPDFVLVREEKPAIIFDAKFRMNWDENVEQENVETQANPLRDDFYKMHTYRDALGISTVVIIYPGTKVIFYDTKKGKMESIKLKDILNGELHGIGAIPLSPRIKIL
jgi:predicted component of viral defense system (DUF524 family)